MQLPSSWPSLLAPYTERLELAFLSGEADQVDQAGAEFLNALMQLPPWEVTDELITFLTDRGVSLPPWPANLHAARLAVEEAEATGDIEQVNAVKGRFVLAVSAMTPQEMTPEIMAYLNRLGVKFGKPFSGQ